MIYSAGPKMPLIFSEQLPTRFTFEEFQKVSGWTQDAWHAVYNNWLWERESPDPFKKWRNPDGFYNPDHKRNLLTGFDDSIDKVSRLSDAHV